MTVNTTAASQSFAGNGVATSFPCDFMIVLATDITASTVNPTTGATSTLNPNTDYTLSGVGAANGFTVVTTVPVPMGTNLLVQRTLSYTQPTDFTNQGAFFPTMHQSAMDRLCMLVQQIAGSVGRSLRVPDGLLPAPSAELPIPSPLSPLAWNAAGDALENGDWSAADVLLRPDLASAASGQGAELIGFQQQGTGSVVSNIKAVMLGFFFTPQMFGAKGDDTTDDTTAVQRWITACQTYGYKGYVPAVAIGYKLTAPINITAGVQILGDGCEPFIGNMVTSGVNTRGRGSWFHIAHTGKGFVVGATGTPLNGVLIQQIATYRDQPTPNGGTYTPASNDYDFYVDTCDATFRDVMLLNPTNGIYHTGGYGRLTCENVRGQPLTIGTFIDGSTDVNRLKGFHWWPFWTGDTGVRAYQLANAIAHKFTRCDDPVMEDCFSIGYNVHTWIGQGGTGSTGNLRMTDCYADLGGPLLYFDTATTGANVMLVNCVCFATTGSGAGEHSNIWVKGTSNQVQLANCRLFNARVNAVRLEGSGNFAEVSNIFVSGWNQGNTSAGAYDLESGAMQIDTKPSNVAGANSGPLFSGVAASSIALLAPLAQGTVSLITDASGFATITHNAGVVPRRMYFGAAYSAPVFIQETGSNTSTTCQVRIWSYTGAVLASTSISVFWRMEY